MQTETFDAQPFAPDDSRRAEVEALRQVVQQVIRTSGLPILAVYLHGSWASKYERPESDIDLAVLAERQLQLAEREEFVWAISKALKFKADIDLADLFGANDVFAAQVLTSSVCLYSVGTAVQKFEIKTLASYARLNEERNGILDDIMKRGEILKKMEPKAT